MTNANRTFRIQNRNTGRDLGTWDGVDADDAYRTYLASDLAAEDGEVYSPDFDGDRADGIVIREVVAGH